MVEKDFGHAITLSADCGSRQRVGSPGVASGALRATVIVPGRELPQGAARLFPLFDVALVAFNPR